MNKRNFGRVIKRIEKEPKLWAQSRVPSSNAAPTCNTPCCFLGHAEFLRAPKAKRVARWVVADHEPLAKWLGISKDDLYVVFDPENTLRDFKRWHKAGKVS